MNKPWLGYLGSFLILAAGGIMLADHQYIVGALLIVMAIAGFVLKARMNARK